MGDLVVFCFGQNEASKVQIDQSVIYCRSDGSRYYFWKYLSKAQGCWYWLNTGVNEIGDTDLCMDLADGTSAFEFAFEEDRRFMYAYHVREQYFESFINIARHLISCSPQNAIGILYRCAPCQTEYIQGKISLPVFENEMRNGRIYANICYIVGDVDRPDYQKPNREGFIPLCE